MSGSCFVDKIVAHFHSTFYTLKSILYFYYVLSATASLCRPTFTVHSWFSLSTHYILHQLTKSKVTRIDAIIWSSAKTIFDVTMTGVMLSDRQKTKARTLQPFVDDTKAKGTLMCKSFKRRRGCRVPCAYRQLPEKLEMRIEKKWINLQNFSVTVLFQTTAPDITINY